MSDVEPTINGVGGEGFAVDGTDSFAIEPVALSDEPSGTPPGSRRGLYMTLATGLALVLIVVIAGSAGGDDQSSLRGSDVSTTEAERSTTTTERTERTDPDDDEASSAPMSGDEVRQPFEVDDEATDDTSFDSEFDDEFNTDLDLDEYDDFDDFDDFDDDEFSSSGGGRYLPRRVPYIPSSRRSTITVPPWYRLPMTTDPDDTEPEDTATTSATTAPESSTSAATTAPTTAATTAPTTAATTASTALPPTWPPTCASGLRVWSRGDVLIAGAPGSGLWSRPAAASGTWTPLGVGEGTAELHVLVGDTAARFWVAGAEGVFRTDDGGANFVRLGTAPLDVQSLGVHVDGGVVTLLAASGVPPATNLHWSGDGGATWAQSTLQPTGTIGSALLVDANSALVGTDEGVKRTDDGGDTWQTGANGGVAVVGTPERRGEHISWLRADGDGVVRSLDGGATWTATTSTDGVASSASRLVELADGRLVTVANNGLVESSDGGSTWAAYGLPVGFSPSGVTFSEAERAAFAWASACGANSVVRVDDP